MNNFILKHNMNPYYENVINSYYENNAKKLNTLVNKILYEKYGGIIKDIEEFYGIATDVFIDICEHDRYDETKGDFDGFLYNSLKFGIIDEIKKRQRDKRCYKIDELDEKGNKILDKNGKPKRKIIQDVSLDAPIQDGENLTYKDTLQSDFDLDEIIINLNYKDQFSPEMNKYLHKLSKVQVMVLFLISEGYKPKEIQDFLHIDYTLYLDSVTAIKSHDNKKCIACLIRRDKNVR